jgi:hypothetical protein
MRFWGLILVECAPDAAVLRRFEHRFGARRLSALRSPQDAADACPRWWIQAGLIETVAGKDTGEAGAGLALWVRF